MATKSVPVLAFSELADGQMKEVAFDKGKVLVYRLGDEVYATSAFCTHYGAPLAKGVLTADARIICPWHGACFNVCSGDIEDAPAPTAIHSFKAYTEDGQIFVTANPNLTTKDNMSRAPILSTEGYDAIGKGVVIIGGGSATYHAIESLREQGYRYPITVLTREEHTPIDRTKLSKALITDASKLEWKNAAELKIKYAINLRTGVNVTSVDIDRRKVVLDGGRDQVSFDKLIIAPGGTPRRLPIPGADLENVITFRTVADSVKVDAAAKEGKNLVVIGSSFISMELVAAVAKRGLASVHVIGMEEFPFQALLGKEVGKGLMAYHEKQGVKFHMQTKIEKIVPGEGDNAHLAKGVVINGEEIPADFVIMGVGVSPATEFLKDNSAITLEKDGSIKVDEFMKVVSVKDNTDTVFAVGDVAYFPVHNTGKYTRIEHWNVAGNQGRTVGNAIAQRPEPYVKVPIFWSAQGQQLRYCGYGADFEDVIIKGDPGELKFVAYYVKGNEVVAVASMQTDPVVSKASELMRLQMMPTPDEIRGGKDILSIDISTMDALPVVKSDSYA